MWEREFSYTVGKNLISTVSVKKECRSSTKRCNIKLLSDPGVPLLHFKTSKVNEIIKLGILNSHVHSSSIQNSHSVESTKVFINKGMDKESIVCVNSRIIFSHKKRIKSHHFQHHG